MPGAPVSLPRTRQCSVKCKATEIEPCFVKSKCKPNISAVVKEAPGACDLDKSSVMLWICCRVLASDNTHTVPCWAGWISLTASQAEDDNQESNVLYMPHVFASITDKFY